MEVIKSYFGKTKLVLMVACFALLSVLPITKVSAVSDYDGLIQVPTELKLSYPGYSDIDMTNKFMDYILGNITSGVGYNDCSTDCKAVINGSVQNGDWAVTQVYSNYPGDQYMIDLTFCNGKIDNTGFSYYYSGPTRTDGLSGSSNTPIDCAVVTIKYQPTTDANHIFIVSNIFQNRTDGAITVSARMKYASGIIPYYIQPYIYTASNTISYPSGYEGTVLADNETDGDGDGLDVVQETIINTSDAKIDTDGDGLDDLTESPWKPNRNAIFCDTSTPKNCTYPNPTKKDIYVEVDWMENGTVSYKPTTSQLSAVVDGLEDNGYVVHIDTGLYGGGEALLNYIQYLPFAYNASSVGFFDLKNGNSSKGVAANFNPIRQGIWHYLISGYGYDEDHSSSGASYAGSGNVFLSLGRVKDNQAGFGYTDLDTAIAGTMVHELGHSLCLSKTQSYSYQSSNCRYTGIDTSAGPNYDSIMNYDLQMFQNNLSYGNNAFGDHDDWGAIDNNGIADFSKWDVSEADFEPGLTIEEAQKAKQKGTLGVVRRGEKVYNLREHKVYDLRDRHVYSVDKNGNLLGLSSSQQNWKDKFTRLIK